MKARTIIILIHGFNIWDGGIQTVGKLRSFFAPFGSYIMLNYGHFGLLDTRFKNDKVAKRLNEAVVNAKLGGYKVIVVGHSNGCAIIHRASVKYNSPIDKVVYINPALQRYLAPASGIKSVDIWYSPSDKPVKLAKWLPTANARPWGDMGAKGYKGTDPRMVSHNKETGYSVSSKEHSDVFKAEKISFFGSLIAFYATRNLT